MFTIPRPNVVASDEGFSVEVLGRTGVRYEDKFGVVTIDGEMLAGPAGFMLYRDSMQTVDIRDGGELNEARRCLIMKNVYSAFSFSGFDIDIL